jgi:hypothetical protein
MSNISNPAVPDAPFFYRHNSGLFLGYQWVALSNIAVLVWHAIWRKSGYAKPTNFSRPLPQLDWAAQIKKHLTNPEGYVMLVLYLATVWHFDLLPAAYYDEQGSVSWPSVFLQLLIVDFLGFLMHKMEHGKRRVLQPLLILTARSRSSAPYRQGRFYKGLRWFKRDAEPVVLIPGHNQHHRYTSPVIFDAFSGSLYEPFHFLLVA